MKFINQFVKQVSMAKKQQDSGLEGIESALTKTEQFIEDHQKPISIVVGAILVVVIFYMLFSRFYKKPLQEEASSQMFMAERYFAADSLRLALNGDGSNLGFIDITDEYGSTKSGNLANYYAGLCYLKLGEYQKAIDYLADFKADESIIEPMALGALGDAYMELGNDQLALKNYKKAANENQNAFTTPRFLKKAAGVLEKLERHEEALEYYQRIKIEYPNSFPARNIDKYIARAKINTHEK